MPRYQAFGSSRECTMISFSLALSLSLSLSLHYLHFVHCSSHFFSFSRVTRERKRDIYIYIYTRVVEHMMRRIGVGGGWKKKFQETRNRRIYDDQNVVIVIVRSDERIVQRCCFAPFTLPPFVLFKASLRLLRRARVRMDSFNRSRIIFPGNESSKQWIRSIEIVN